VKLGERALEAIARSSELGGPPGPLRSDGQRDCVLQVGAAELDHVDPLDGMLADGPDQAVDARQRVLAHRDQPRCASL
jgi:hypothetical protein